MRGKSLILIVLGMMLLASCRRSTFNPGNNPPPGPQYDPRNISRTDSTQSFGPWIAIGPDETVYVAWMDGGETQYSPSRIYFRYKPPGGDWSDREILSDSLHDAWAPHIAADPFGNVHLVWQANTIGQGDFKIYYRMRTATGEWTRTVVLSGDEQADQPRISVDSTGTVHVIWMQGFGMKYRRRAVNGSWSEIEAVPVGRQGAINPSICADMNEGVHIVYEAGNEDIKYLYRSPTGDWSEPVNVSQSPGWYSWVPSVAVSSSGLIWINWVERGERAMYYTIKEAGGDWSIPDSVPGIPGYPWTNCIQFDQNRKLHYIWEEWRNGSYDIYHKFYDDGEWSVEENLSETPGESFTPNFAIGNDGIYVVWSEKEEDGGKYNWEIYFRVISLP